MMQADFVSRIDISQSYLSAVDHGRNGLGAEGSVENLVSHWNGHSRERSSSVWHQYLSDNAGQGSAKPKTTVTVVNVLNVAAIGRRRSTEDLDASRERWHRRGFLRDSPYLRRST